MKNAIETYFWHMRIYSPIISVTRHYHQKSVKRTGGSRAVGAKVMYWYPEKPPKYSYGPLIDITGMVS